MRLPAMITAASIAIASPSFAQSTATVRADLDAGFASYAAGKYADALAAFEAAAERDNAVAQEILGMMYMQGEKLYPDVRADPEKAIAWLRRAAANGSEVAGHLVGALQQRIAQR
jgi:TPR repeat protein